MSTQPKRTTKRYTDGRDEMNLAEFPISVLQRQQPVDEQGIKLDTVTYEASRYDPSSRQRLQQRVVLETSSRHGLPTPADENVVLALLYLAKHSHDFASPVVHFSPRQLFHIMGWAPNSRSYTRLREVLRRLKSLVIRYENSWWDIAGRGYEAEFATGIISEYELVRQVSGKPKTGEPPSYVRWTPHFHQSLNRGNLKKLDLELLFSLRLPTAQRMYRFLDKRFYPRHQPPAVEMDLHDFACGHIGLSRVENVAELKRRLAPAIEELEAVGFIAPAGVQERYQKVRAGVWRVRFTAGPRFLSLPSEVPVAPPPATTPPRAVEPEKPAGDGWNLAAAFYRTWDADGPVPVGPRDLLQAQECIRRYGIDTARALIPVLVSVVRRKWPDCKSFSGAAAKYLGEAAAAFERQQSRSDRLLRDREQQQREREEAQRYQEERRRLEARWQGLPAEEQRAIEEEIRRQYPDHLKYPAIFRRLCLDRLAALPENLPNP
jgi:hypothetical protein